MTAQYVVVSNPNPKGEPEVIRVNSPMPDQKWRYHIAPVVFESPDKPMVFDLCLEKPVPLSEWEQCFSGESNFVTGGDELAKKHGELDFEYPQQLTSRMQHLWCKQVCADD